MHYLILYASTNSNVVKYHIAWGFTDDEAVSVFQQELDKFEYVDILSVTPHEWKY